VELTDPGQQLRPGRPGLPLPGQDHAEQAPVVAQPGQQAERVIGGSGTGDLIVNSIPFAKLSLDDISPLRIVVNDQQDWSIWHRRHP
jgi:hypothetical protein